LERLPAPENAPPPLDPSIVTWRNIREALDTLSADDRELVLLVAWDGLSPAQAGGVLGLTPVAARSRLHRARAKLAAILDVEQRSAPTGHEPGESTPLRRSGA
jgi:DNA-directed RNA polymerase specialized sigma24 family protein